MTTAQHIKKHEGTKASVCERPGIKESWKLVAGKIRQIVTVKCAAYLSFSPPTDNDKNPPRDIF